MSRRVLASGFVVAMAAVVAARLARWPLDAYGDSAAQYIEHLARLRLVERIQQGVDPNPVRALVQLDGLYPPGLHLVTAALSPLVGHHAEVVVFTMLAWWALLVGSVGLVGRRLGGSGAWVAAATAAVPALHAAATRYYYDLPMTALLWAAVAVLVGVGRPALRGLGAGALLAAACLVKWTALPFGLVMLVAAATAGALALGALAGGFLAAGSTSFAAMGGATFQPPPGVTPDAVGVLAPLPGVRAAALQLLATDADRLAFYPTRLVATVLSPALLIAAVPAWAGWLRDRGPGAALVGLTAFGHLAFVLLLVPPLDDRFLLTLAPALALAAGLGAPRLPGRLPAVLAGIGALVGIGVAVDAHLRPPSAALHTTPTLRDDALDGRTVSPRLGLGSSWDLRGWSRSDTARRDRTALRLALDARLSTCAEGPIHGALSAWGDQNWFGYREALARVEARPVGLTWRGEDGAPALRVEAPGPVEFALDDPDGGPGLTLPRAGPRRCPE